MHGRGWGGERREGGVGQFWHFKIFLSLLILDVVMGFKCNLDAFMGLLLNKRVHETLSIIGPLVYVTKIDLPIFYSGLYTYIICNYLIS